MNIRSIALAALAVVALAGTASAADLVPMRAIPLAPIHTAYDWTGPYAGVSAGYGGGHTHNTHQITDYTGFAGQSYANDLSGWGLGAQAGYNYQFGNFVVGAEGQYLGTNINGTTNYPAYNLATSSSVNDLVLATVKAGYAFDDLLVYGKAGYAGGSVNGGSAYSPAAPAKGVTWTDTEWQNGWTVGAGAAYALTKNLRVNADYNFVDLGTAPFGAKDSVGTPTSIGTHTTDNVFTVGLNYAF